MGKTNDQLVAESSELISTRLQQLLAQQITAAGGFISFADFMHSALYTPELGYYCRADKQIFGSSGDFVTAPELTNLFAITLAEAIIDLWQQLAANIAEYGAGSGQLALDVLLQLQHRQSLPEKYYIIEISPALRSRQQRLFAKYQQFANIVIWTENIAEKFDGVIIANEVIDAMPVHLVFWQDQQILQRGVSLATEITNMPDNVNNLSRHFTLIEQKCSGDLLEQAINIQEEYAITPPYLSEINLAQRDWLQSISDKCQQAAILIFDYGFPGSEYYHPQRDQGTLMAHWQQHSLVDPLYRVGECDLTAHVDFTSVVSSAYQSGFELTAYCSQAQFLLNYGILNHLAERFTIGSREYIVASQAVNQLLSPAEMGELFKLMILSKNTKITLDKLQNCDRRFSL